ncbi:cryptochrome-1 [Gaeumannomyces tritici R3-111a-1]|uniref:Cryptochrome-1 n=1 Tax=Gaeumannomyces tritici (strain R3-111a-1) TaxID=644352 RepID=J3PBY9_GAET3|nr:cryptochrome-1 [Gaeumannomyces tritici R3-111a-1]EJT71759.1 cryptochrome-1 [Gaeumannomyces tritici R3-111a-1]
MSKARVIYWFRTDLRLHDSPALQAALDLDPAVLWPIFTWDPHYVYRARGGLNRWQFLLDCQNDLSASINKLNPKSKLFVLREAPQTLFPKLFKAWDVTHIVFEKDTDSYARRRDAVVTQAARDAGVRVITRCGRTLWDSDRVVIANGGEPTMSITQLRVAGAKVGPIPLPIAAPTTLPDPGEMPVDFEVHLPNAEASIDINSKWRSEGKDTTYGKGSVGEIAGPNGDFAVETLAELGYPPATTPHKGGETLALQRLDELMADQEYTATFRKPQSSPADFDPPSTTLLSPFLHFGALSVRLFYHRVQDAVDAYVKSRKKGASQPPESLTGQLLFRDMYFAAQAAIGDVFGQTAGNPRCRFIPWHLPSRLEGDAGPLRSFAYDVDSAQAEDWFRRWEAGRTGFPWIDALMRQLRVEGWIHHLGRHSVACFLTRGGCYVSWERGLDVFEELLLDHEPSCNAGNWQWLSCTAFFSQYFRCYSPVSFGRKWDPEGTFVRRWVPELAALDKKYIYEPWKAPEAELRRAGVVLVDGSGAGVGRVRAESERDDDARRTGTYITPMFDFDERRRICMSSMKMAYDVGLKGDDPRVLDGSWRELFSEHGNSNDGEMMGTVKQEESDHGELADEADGPKARTEDGPHAAVKREKGQTTLDRHVKRQRRSAAE